MNKVNNILHKIIHTNREKEEYKQTTKTCKNESIQKHEAMSGKASSIKYLPRELAKRKARQSALREARLRVLRLASGFYNKWSLNLSRPSL